MKKIYLIITVIFISFGCKAQIIEPLDGNGAGPNVYLKDVNNIRDSFVGTWYYTDGYKEFILHIYKDDMVSQGNWWGQGEFWMDELIGNYIYKENGVEIINSTQYMPNLENITVVPFMATTKNGITTYIHSSLRDFGTVLLKNDCESYFKKSGVEMTIINPGGNPLQASFILTGTPKVIPLGNNNCATWIDGYSIPENMTLTKISDTPPPLN